VGMLTFIHAEIREWAGAFSAKRRRALRPQRLTP
jgi:hypothetical protein